ncbi:MAG: SelL-related redox protein [Phycisphaerales bacterium]
MRRWLVAAGIYNIAWGGAAAVAPVWTLRLLGVRPASTELWPQFWACIGMIVGVYGVGYLIASRDPVRHWPIVLVGLLGKVLGPIGFVQGAIAGSLPWSLGLSIVTNDLLWWVPFAMILWHAVRSSQPAPPEGEIGLAQALDDLRDDAGRSLRAITDERPTLVVLLRHAGCTFCKQTLADLARQQATIERAGVGVAVVGMSPSSAALRAFGEQYGLASAKYLADPDRRLYRALELRRGRFLQLFGPRVWVEGVRSALRGHGVGRLVGDGFQMPGAFVIHRGSVIRAYRHETAADRPDLEALACRIS